MTEFVVRDGYRRIGFSGDLLAKASSKRPGVWRWTELALYRTANGVYILQKVGASRVMHVRDCPEVVDNLPRFQAVYPGEDPDDDEFLFCDCVPDIYDFPSLLVESDRHWAQINDDDPVRLIKSLMRYKVDKKTGTRTYWFPRASSKLLEQAAELDWGIAAAYHSSITRIA